MKKLSLIAAALALATSGAFAQTAQDTFDVTINFTASCSVTTAASDLVFDYTAFGAAQNGTTNTVFQCSRGLTPTFAFDDSGADQTGSAAAATATNITAEGVIAGIRYRLTGVTSVTSAGTAATAGALGAVGTNGTAATYNVAISANIPGNQAGDGSTTGGTHTRTLTISY